MSDSAKRRCPVCGAFNAEGMQRCTQCGRPLVTVAGSEDETVYGERVCSRCGRHLPPGSKFCGFCGEPLVAPTPGLAKKPAQVPTHPSPAIKPADIPTKLRPAVTVPPAGPPPAPSESPSDAGTTVAATGPRPTTLEVRPPEGVPDDQPPSGTVTFVGFIVPRLEAKVTEVRPDGSAGKTVEIHEETFIGRMGCELSYPRDPLLAERHASLMIREGRLFLREHDRQHGAYVKQRQDTELTPGDVFLLGRDLFRFTLQSLESGAPPSESPQGTYVMMGAPKLQRGPMTARLEHIDLSGSVIQEYSLEKPETTLGRKTGDIVFKDDPFMSGLHARIVAQPGRFMLQDLRSKNGVYRRIRDEVELKDGDEFFVGEQLFRTALRTVE
ncbi:MAG TPA: FHA domain-containing protein [Terriglobia bacterium]|nr:FHA domain-containing protein [Terriglobia bacterium]